MKPQSSFEAQYLVYPISLGQDSLPWLPFFLNVQGHLTEVVRFASETLTAFFLLFIDAG